MAAPLAGLRVVGLEQAVAGPVCTRHLLDMGAEVIKVERIGAGDFARSYNTHVRGYSSYDVWLNRGKRSMAVDLKNEAGRGAFFDICATADVLVANLAPRTCRRIAPDADLAERCPRLLRCYISGFGPGGAYSSRKAYDLIIQGEAGVTRSTGTAAAPAKTGISVADLAGGLHAATVILGELLAQRGERVGKRVDISLFDVMVDWMGPALLSEAFGPGAPPPNPLRHAGLVPYGAFESSDGQLVNIAVQNPAEWERLCHLVLRDPELATDQRFGTNSQRVQLRAEVEGRVERALGRLPAAEIVQRLEAADLAWGRLNTTREVLSHDQLASPIRWAAVGLPDGGEVDAPRSPLSQDLALSDSGTLVVPRVGQHTREILERIGYSQERLRELTRQGVVGEDTTRTDVAGHAAAQPRGDTPVLRTCATTQGDVDD